MKMHEGSFDVRLHIDGRDYEIRMFAEDELDVMMRLMEMRDKKPRSPFHETDDN